MLLMCRYDLNLVLSPRVVVTMQMRVLSAPQCSDIHFSNFQSPSVMINKVRCLSIQFSSCRDAVRTKTGGRKHAALNLA